MARVIQMAREDLLSVANWMIADMDLSVAQDMLVYVVAELSGQA